MTDPAARLFPASESQRFLARHWQRAPLFLPAALRTLPPVPDWRRLAARDDVESRRIETLSGGRFQLTEGPIEGADPARPWTVLIQDADYHAPSLRVLLEAVDFLPVWRIDDIMMSVAGAGGSVGPHVDAYDVFLVQARGTRQWQIGRPGNYVADPDDSGLRLVRPFEVAQRVRATPGDVLYLPPDVPHHGVADDDCVTYSIGFRAPTLLELAAIVLEKLPADRRYADPGAAAAKDPVQIDQRTLARLREQLRAFFDLDDATLATALGETMTEMKPWLAPDEDAIEEDREDALHDSRYLVTWPGMRLARYDGPDSALLFANGRTYPLAGATQTAFADTLARARRVRCPQEPACRDLVRALLDEGIVRFANDD